MESSEHLLYCLRRRCGSGTSSYLEYHSPLCWAPTTIALGRRWMDFYPPASSEAFILGTLIGSWCLCLGKSTLSRGIWTFSRARVSILDKLHSRSFECIAPLSTDP